MSDYFEKLKEIVHKAGMFRILVVIVSGVLLLLISYGKVFEKEEPRPAETVEEGDNQASTGELGNYREQMEGQVKAILEKVEGVGAVDVMLTLREQGVKTTTLSKPNPRNQLNGF